MGQVNLPSNFLDRIKRLEQQLAAVRKAIGLTSATITHGDLTVDGGQIVIKGSGGLVLPVGGTVTDANGNLLLQSDPAGGIAYPWMPVPMSQDFTGNASLNSFGEPNMVQSVGGTGLMSHGYIPYIQHPRLQVGGIFGPDTAGQSVTYEVRLYDSSGTTLISTLGSFTLGSEVGGTQATYDVTPWLGHSGYYLSVWCTSHTTGSGHFYCQPAVFLRGSV